LRGDLQANHCTLQKQLRDREAKRLRRLEIDHQLEFRRLLDRELAGFGAFEDFVYKRGRATVEIGPVRPRMGDLPLFRAVDR
jgi:hypothetical protein